MTKYIVHCLVTFSMYDTPNVFESPCLTAGLSSPVRDVMLGSITLGDTQYAKFDSRRYFGYD